MGRLTEMNERKSRPTKIGLVLAGGGGKGAYQVGVWKAIKEYDLDRQIVAISGTSVGALNGVLFATKSVGEAENVWSTISPEKILSIDLSGLNRLFRNSGFNLSLRTVELLAGSGVFSREGLANIIEDFVNLDYINEHSLPVYAAAYDSNQRRPHYFLLNHLGEDDKLNALLASSALPFIFDPIRIDGTTYWDGGLVDNTPIIPLYDSGCSVIIVVHLNRTTIVDKSKYPEANIIEIFPRSSIGEFIDGTLDFSPSNAYKRMLQGYEDAKSTLETIFKVLQTQTKLLEGVSGFVQGDEYTYENLKVILSEREELKKMLKGVPDEAE